jgi:ParB-like chromosome segregation protein Spo0J
MKPRADANGIAVFCSHDKLADPAGLVANPRNPNTHPESQIEILSRIIKTQGWRSPIVVSKRSGFIVKGHGRLAAALRLGTKLVPVDFQEYETEAAEWADLIADNRIAELAETNHDELKKLMVELKSQDFDLDLTGFSGADLESWLKNDLISAGQERGTTPDEALESYEQSSVRQIVLIMDVAEFEEIMGKLEIIKKAKELENNTLAAMVAIREYANSCS